MTGIRELLDDAALEPNAALDVDELERRARRHRRRTISVAVTTGVVVAVLVAVGAVAVQTEDHASSVRTPAAESATAPELLRRAASADGTVSIDLPEGWRQLPTIGGEPVEVLVIGTDDRPDSGVLTQCPPTLTVDPELPQVWVSIFEYLPGMPLSAPGGKGSFELEVIGDRPADFRAAPPLEASCVSASDHDPGRSGPDNHIARNLFRDGDRVFLAQIVAVGDDHLSALANARVLLNTLRVEPRTAGADEEMQAAVEEHQDHLQALEEEKARVDDEGAAQVAVMRWLDAPSSEAGREYIEDYDALADALREGEAQHAPDALAAFSGRVEAATLIDADRVEVRYTLLQYGRPLYPNIVGTVVRIDGTWKVSRETVCDLLARGGVMCPPRQ